MSYNEENTKLGLACEYSLTCHVLSAIGAILQWETFAFWSGKFHTNDIILSTIWPETLMRPFPGKIPTSYVGLKWQHETNEMATNNTTRGSNCNSDEDNLSA